MTQYLLGGVAEKPLRARVPGGDHAVQTLADDCVPERLYDGSQLEGPPLRPLVKNTEERDHPNGQDRATTVEQIGVDPARRSDEEGQDGQQRACGGGNPYGPEFCQQQTGPDHGDVEWRRRPTLGH